MKKGVLFTVFILLLLSISFVIAQDENTTVDTSLDKIDNAYTCLEKEIGDCSSLTVEDRIFSLLARGKCEDAVMADSESVGEYWPRTNPSLKTTAQAILALDKTTKSTISAEKWLISQNTSPSDVIWYLQIESTEETICTITYRGDPYKVTLYEDKTLNNDAGICLDLTSDEFWLKVAPGCFDEEFEISCDKSFSTNLLFKRKTSSVLHISSQTNIASASGKTTEKVHSSCFMEDGNCDYEGSLWAAFVLDYKGYDMSDYMPYLLTMAEENLEYLPESFLYALTGQVEYKNNLLLRQKESQYWRETGDKFYDTAIALYSISDEPTEKTNTKNWLLEIQESDGCFPTGIKNNAFLLASIWPRPIDPTVTSCVSMGWWCGSEISCEGNRHPEYYCGGTYVCCDTQPTLQSCAEQLGEICTSDQQCYGGTKPEASDTTSLGLICCVGGECRIPVTTSDCEDHLGVCELSCTSGEIEVDYECADYGYVCCIKGEEPISLWWLWLLIILIILVVVGILFRKKLRPLFRKPPRGPIGPRPMGPRPRPGMPPSMARRPIQRKILPPQRRRHPLVRPAKKPSELGDVLKKLKQMSK